MCVSASPYFAPALLLVVGVPSAVDTAVPEVGLAGVRVLPLPPNPQAGVVVPAEGVVREVLDVAPSMRPSLPSLECVVTPIRGRSRGTVDSVHCLIGLTLDWSPKIAMVKSVLDEVQLRQRPKLGGRRKACESTYTRAGYAIAQVGYNVPSLCYVPRSVRKE